MARGNRGSDGRTDIRADGALLPVDESARTEDTGPDELVEYQQLMLMLTGEYARLGISPTGINVNQLSLALQEVLAVDQFGAGASANFSERWSRYPVGTHRPANVGALQKEAIAFFEQKGWTHEQAIGLVANINAESGFDLRCVDDGGLAVGLAQWHPDRQAKMVAFAQYAAQHPDKYPEFKGANITKVMDANLEQQLSMMDYELRHGDEQRAGNVLQQQTSAAASAAAISTYYERPADKYGQAQHRAAEADGIAAAVPKTPNGPPLAGLKSRGEVPATAAPTTGTPAPEGVAPTAASAPTAHPLSPNAAA